MPWLNVPHLRQIRDGWCLPACIAMVAAYWQRPTHQADIARWLGARPIGAPASRVYRLAQRGFNVVYRTGSLVELEAWLALESPPIVFLRTVELPYWDVDTPHAVVVAGMESGKVYLFDPAIEQAPVSVLSGDLMLAWSYFDYTYAVISPAL